MRTLAPRRARTLLSAASAGLLAAGALSAAAPAIAGQATAAPATDPVDTTSTAVSTTDDTATSNAYIVKHKADSEPADVLTAQSAGTDVEGELPAATTTAIDEAADATSADVDVEAVTAHSGDLASVQLSSTLDEADAQAFVSSLTSDPSVEYVQPDIVMTALAVLSTPNDTYFSKQWDLGPASSWGMNATAAWSRATGEGVTVAGTIAAQPNNSTGTAGVAPNARIEPVRVLGLCGGSSSDIVDGITWASGGHVNGVPDNDNPAKVINMSLGGSASYCPSYYQETIDAATEPGSIIVVAAGNEDDDAAGDTPANCDSVITVGSTGDQGARAYYSNYGSTVEVSAPGGDMKSGEDVLSTVDSGTTTPQGADYGYMQGTSRATPHVAGTIALMAQVKPSLTTAEATRILQDTSYPLASCDTGAGTCGTGIIDAAKAVASVAGTTPAPEPTAPATTEPTAAPTPTTNPGNPTGGRGIGEYYYCQIFGCD
ncbi:S8 family serine peptidase [Actinomyces radicidentis]|uniref:S8 family serine peptidase n=1 Tax=Actinomyces radicidentis TaxID=111015 RepID=UPI0028E9FBF3|nr:S8 family serine peptidase [Actinomyces radicidentis]